MCDEVKVKENPKNESTIVVPDHPMLETFQKSLKEHLLSLIDRVKGEVYEIETEIAKKNAEVENVGLTVYQQQQFVCNKQETLGSLMQNVEMMKEKCKQEEEELEKNTKVLKEINEKLFDTQKTTRVISKELNAIRELNNSLADAENHIEKHLKVNKTIASKRRTDNETLSKDKKKQDYLIHSLVAEIWKLENEMETLELAATAKRAYIDNMDEKIAVGNTTISALETEYRCLLQSWNWAVVAIGHRDEKLDCIRRKLNVLTSTHKNLTKEMDSFKRQIKQTLAENEKLTSLHSNSLREIERNKQSYEQDLIKKEELLKDMAQLECIINETERDAKRVEEENRPLQLRFDQLQKEIDGLAEKRLTIKRDIESLLSQKTCNTALNKRQQRIVEDVIKKREESDLILRKTINRSAAIHTEIEVQKLKNEELYNQSQEIKRDISALNADTDRVNKQVESQEYAYRKERTKYKLIREKLNEVMSRQADGKATSNQELRIQELEKLIQDGEMEIKKLQQIWLCEQNTMIKLAKERQEQIQTANIKRKQVLMSEQQNMRIRETLEQIKREEEHTELNIRRHTVRSKQLCEEVYNKRSRRQTLDKDNIFFKNQFEEKLRDAEFDLLKIESEIAGIEENKLMLSKDLIECNREALAWESKNKMARDALAESSLERNKGGEINVMRNKLSQGKVFLGELKKNQEKILKELQICISKRDSIFFKCEAKQQIEKSKRSPVDRTRVNFARKIADMRNQIKHVSNEIQTIKKEIKMAKENKITKENNLNDVAKRIKFTIEIAPVLKTQLEETITNKRIKFELLVYHQRRAELHRLLVKGRNPYRKFKKDEDLVYEYEKQKGINNKLKHLITELEKQFPMKHQDLIRLFNSLTILIVA